MRNRLILVVICFLFSGQLAAGDKTFQMPIESIDLKLSDAIQLGKDQFPISGTLVTLSQDPNSIPEKIKISGKVTDKAIKPIIGATVKTSLNTLVKTNSVGDYALEEKAVEFDLIVKANGYIKQVKHISSQTKGNIIHNFSLKKESGNGNSSGSINFWLILFFVSLLFWKLCQQKGVSERLISTQGK